MTARTSPWLLGLASIAAGIMMGVPYLVPQAWPLSFVALVPFYWMVEHSTPLRAFAWGYLSGFVCSTLLFHWLTFTLVVYGGFPLPAAVLTFLVFAFIFGTKLPVMAVVLRLLRTWVPWSPVYLYPPAVVAAELLQLALFPWYLGSPHIHNLYFMQIVDVTGVVGLTFPLAMVAAAIFQRWTERRIPRRAALATLLVLLAVYGYGVIRYHQVRALEAAAAPVNVAVVQPNTPLRSRDPLVANQIMDACRDLTQDAARQAGGHLDLVVWPEGGTPFSLDSRHAPVDDAFRMLVVGLATSLHAQIMLNDHLFEGKDEFNNVYLVGRSGEILGNYKKMFLLAFGEYIPFSDAIPALRGIGGVGNFTPGHDIRVLHADCGTIAAQVCYEIIFPGLTRRFVKLGADCIVNATNDAWFGPTTASWCHLMDGLPRAIENRTPLVRCTNSGTSTIVSACGDFVVPPTALFVPAAAAGVIHPPHIRTFYTEYGDIFGILCAAWTVGLLLRNVRKKQT